MTPAADFLDLVAALRKAQIAYYDRGQRGDYDQARKLEAFVDAKLIELRADDRLTRRLFRWLPILNRLACKAGNGPRVAELLTDDDGHYAFIAVYLEATTQLLTVAKALTPAAKEALTLCGLPVALVPVHHNAPPDHDGWINVDRETQAMLDTLSEASSLEPKEGL